MIWANPITIVVGIVAAVSLAGIVAAFVRNRRKFRGYQELAIDAREIVKKIKGQVFRDGDDLVISGNYEQLPTIVRLSHAENTPGLSIEMKVPSRFGFWLTPKQSNARPGGALVAELNFAAAFSARSDSALEAQQLIQSSAVKKALARVCISNKMSIEITPGRLVINELLIPANLHRRVVEELNCGVVLSSELEKFPGADALKIRPLVHDRTSWSFRAALAAGVLVAVMGVAQVARSRPATAATPPPQSAIDLLIPKTEAALIPRLQEWEPAKREDFAPEFVYWLQGYGLPPKNVVHFSSTTSRVQDGKAYFLVNEKNQRRVIVIVDQRVAFDAVFPEAAGLAVVPMDSVNNVEWPMSRAPFKSAPGDGLLLVRNPGQAEGANLIFFAENRLVSGTPKNYERLDVR